MPSDGALFAYVPTFARLTVGNGAVTAFYSQQGKRVSVLGSVKLGSTSSLSAGSGVLTVGVSLPVAAATRYGIASDAYQSGHVGALDTGTNIYGGGFASIEASTTEAKLYMPGAGGVRTPIHATSPFTFTTGDIVSFEFEYEAA